MPLKIVSGKEHAKPPGVFLEMNSGISSAQKAKRLRSLAARMRACAAETNLNLYRRQFERLACDLEEAAVDQESRPPKPH